MDTDWKPLLETVIFILIKKKTAFDSVSIVSSELDGPSWISGPGFPFGN